MDTINGIEVTLHTPDVVEFLSAHPDPQDAAEQYRAEYERRLRILYPTATVEVVLGVTNGLGNRYALNGQVETHSSCANCDDLAEIEFPLVQMANDWSWLRESDEMYHKEVA